MATKISAIYTLITANAEPLKRGLVSARKSAIKGASKIQKALNKINFRAIGLGATAFGGVVALSMKKAVDAASDLEEATGKFNVVFRDQLSQAEEWSRGLVAAYGLSTREAKEYMSSIQDLLKPMGVASDEAARLSNEVVKLAVDLGSFNNQKTPDVMRDIQSALVGNYETMKKYGVVLNVATIRQEALRTGMIRGKEVMTAAQKATAAYTLIVAGSADAIGDAIRTQSGYENTMKRMSSTIENVAAKIGDPLMPAIADVVRSFDDWLKSNNKLINQDMPRYTREVGEAIGTVAEASVKLIQIYDKLPGGTAVAAAGGYIGWKLFGNWKMAKWLAMGTVINEVMKSFDMDLGSVLGKYREFRDAIYNIIDEISEKLRTDPIVLKFDMPDRFISHVDAWEANIAAVKKRKEELLKSNAAAAAAAAAEKKLHEQIKKTTDEYIATLPSIKLYRDAWQVRDERTFTDEQLDKLEQLNELSAKAYDAMSAHEANRFRQSKVLQRDSIKNNEKTFDTLIELSERTAFAMQQNFSDLFFDIMDQKFTSLRDYANAMLTSIKRALADVAGQQLTTSIFGALPTITGGGKADISEQHGGFIGEKVRGFGTSSGKSYEFHPNEWVIPNDKMGSGVNVDVNVTNNLGQEAQVDQSSSWVSPDRIVADIVLNKKLTSRGFRQGLRA